MKGKRGKASTTGCRVPSKVQSTFASFITLWKAITESAEDGLNSVGLLPTRYLNLTGIVPGLS